jgi:GNAT superfamily N-acetyltransferase
MSAYEVRTFASDERIARAAGVIIDAAWNDLNFLNFTRSHADYYDFLMEHYADHQLALVDSVTGYVVATANCVPLYTPDPRELPDTGWDWVLETAFRTTDRAHNLLGGIAISVSPAYRSGGHARTMIKAMGELCIERGYDRLVIPVRPTLKTQHVSTSFDDYMAWTDPSGRPYDPWLRSHVSMGGTPVGIARESMVVEEPVGFWEAWHGQRITESGPLHIRNGLVPVEIDMERGIGRYAEPNVWMAYPGAALEKRAAA